MAQISSYPLLIPQLGDKILGSNNIDSAGNAVTGNPTCQFNLTSVKTIVDQNYIQKLSASNPTPFTPGNNNTGNIITFGAAQGTTADDVMIDAAGKVTFNIKGNYIIEQIYYAQATANNNAVLNWKTLQNVIASNGVTVTTQIGPTTTHTWLSTTSTARHRVDITSYINVVAGAYYNFWLQNPTTGATGNLTGQTIADAWATDVPSAQLIITKLV